MDAESSQSFLQSSPRWWPRFSLLTAFLSTTVVATGIVIVLLWREVGPLRAEVRQMRTELGHLTIDDPSRATGIQVRQYDQDFWRWRIYLPPGGQYSLHCHEGTLPARGNKTLQQWLDMMPQTTGGGTMISGYGLDGERTWEASVTEKNGQWTIRTKPGGGSIGFQFKDDWFAGTRVVGSDLQTDSQATFAPDQPILLLYIPKPDATPGSGGGTSYTMPTGAAEGIVMWIEQHPSPPVSSTPATTVPPTQ